MSLRYYHIMEFFRQIASKADSLEHNYIDTDADYFLISTLLASVHLLRVDARP